MEWLRRSTDCVAWHDGVKKYQILAFYGSHLRPNAQSDFVCRLSPPPPPLLSPSTVGKRTRLLIFGKNHSQGDKRWQVTGDLALTLEYVLTESRFGIKAVDATTWTIRDVSVGKLRKLTAPQRHGLLLLIFCVATCVHMLFLGFTVRDRVLLAVFARYSIPSLPPDAVFIHVVSPKQRCHQVDFCPSPPGQRITRCGSNKSRVFACVACLACVLQVNDALSDLANAPNDQRRKQVLTRIRTNCSPMNQKWIARVSTLEFQQFLEVVMVTVVKVV